MKKLSCLLIIALAFAACNNDEKNQDLVEVKKVEKAPILKEYGFVLNNYEVVRDTIQSGDSFGELLDRQGVSRSKVFDITQKVSETFNPTRLVVGKPYVILKAKDSARTPQFFIYENDKIDYTVVNVADDIAAYKAQKPVSIKRRTVSGVIVNNLSEAMQNQGLSVLLSHKLSSIYQWSIDFWKLQKGDQFKMVYNERYINDTIYAGVENIEGAVFVHQGRPYYAFSYLADPEMSGSDFYDEEARPLESFFLKAPLNFSRISSRYSGNRYHPVQKRWKAHKGTDYAAPHGTPIWSTANGTVIASSYTSGNGNYVKVKHNETYTTQYLHMSKRNVRVGQRVRQGDVIGYVGSTGLATGPHVCYRFWVRGKQVDPFRQNLPAAEPIADNLKEDYFAAIKPVKIKLDKIPFKEI
ncbi:peptidoglycan DD-metalloendopeptidase family protein [Gillisia sp. M10.2A]|uniref:Peptidoglycan DD-metalloendopeptidase family protein n=1 Tax=Gillisia lutea TaxID=2909668 RepID=A0ABS9ED04_9FLAO|nr:peptidoglycan DD-metalloendopeptidase family protein [Gillisia lutea]MCF4100751.1 peptidoglycan DD-metalloendopeptidase family protein [Gillisia lutea]